MTNEDTILLEFTVLWEAWECDSKAWVMERPDGTRYLKMTSHGGGHEASHEQLIRRIAEYAKVLRESCDALELLNKRRER